MKNNILKLIASNAYIITSKELARVFGLNAAVLLGELASKHNYWEAHNKLTEDGFFFATAEDIEHETTLSAYQQRAAIAKLEKLGVVETKLKGIPAVKYFKLDAEKLSNYMLGGNTRCEEIQQLDNEESDIRCEETQQLDNEESYINNNIKNNNKEINKDITINRENTLTSANSTNLPISENSDSFKDIVSVKDTDSTVNIDTVKTDSTFKKDEIENSTMGIVNDRSLESNLHASGDAAACDALAAKKPITMTDLKKSKAYKNVMAYLNALTCSNEIKEALISWYDHHAKGRLSVQDVENNIKSIYFDCNNNTRDILTAIQMSDCRGWFKFRKQGNSYNNSYNNQRTAAATSSSKERYYKESDDYFKDIEEKVKNGEGEIF